MPLIEVTLVEGRSPEEIRSVIESLTVAMEKSTAIPRSMIHVIVRMVPETHWASGNETIAEIREKRRRNCKT
jgi:4-oxalocrotonate tautomerase